MNNNQELLNQLKIAAQRCGFLDIDISCLLNESKYWISQVFSGKINPRKNMIKTIELLINFLNSLAKRNYVFKKSMYESTFESSKRRKLFALQIKDEFIKYVNYLEKRDNERAKEQ